MNFELTEIFINRLNGNSINNYSENFHSYLTLAVKSDNIKFAETLLQKGANPNGITFNGIGNKIPFTSLNFESNSLYTMIRVLLKNKADINAQDLSGDTVLTSYINFIVTGDNFRNKKYIDILLFLLERGTSPDGTITKNPLSILVNKLLTCHYIPAYTKIYDLCEMLIAYGANPKFKTIHLTISRGRNNNIYNAIQIFNKIVRVKNSAMYRLFNNLFNINIDHLVSQCNSPVLLSSLAKFYKIPYTENDPKSMTNLCNCIKTINKNKKFYDEDKFIAIRSHQREISKNKCQNSSILITGDQVDSYPPSEIILLHEKNPDFTFCFHVSEIPSLLAQQKNIHTNRPLEPEFIEELVTKHKFFVAKTLSETLDGVFEFKDNELINEDLIVRLEIYIKSFNEYIDVRSLLDMSVYDYMYLQDMLYDNNEDIINQHFLYWDRNKKRGESMDDYKKRVLERTLTHMLVYITRNTGTLSFISHLVMQIIDDVHAASETLKFFPENMHTIVKTFSDRSYFEFIHGVAHFILASGHSLSELLLFDPFVEYLKKKNVRYIDENDVIFNSYCTYIKKGITKYLSSEYPGGHIDDIWNSVSDVLGRNLNVN
jgi:hypothetical protein